MVDQWPDQRLGLARIADFDAAEQLPQPADQLIGNRLMDDQASQGGAALTGSAGGGEQDRPLGQRQISRRRDDHRIIAAQL